MTKTPQQIKNEVEKEKFILDACCGGRMFWFNKTHPNTIYIDNRVRKQGHQKTRPNHHIEPDIVMDNRKMDFMDKSFKLVVFDPPHLFAKDNCEEKGFIMGKCFGWLNKDTWKEDIKRSFNECWRVLEDYGVLIFKWNESSIKKKEILEVLEREPLFGHPNKSGVSTHWFCFMKIPEKELLSKIGEEKQDD